MRLGLLCTRIATAANLLAMCYVTVAQAQSQLLQLQQALTFVSGTYVEKLKGSLNLVTDKLQLQVASIAVQSEGSQDLVSILRAGQAASGMYIPGYMMPSSPRALGNLGQGGMESRRSSGLQNGKGLTSALVEIPKLDSITEQQRSEEKHSTVESGSCAQHMLVTKVQKFVREMCCCCTLL